MTILGVAFIAFATSGSDSSLGGMGQKAAMPRRGYVAEHQRALVVAELARGAKPVELLFYVCVRVQGLAGVGVIAISAGHHEREHLPHLVLQHGRGFVPLTV